MKTSPGESTPNSCSPSSSASGGRTPRSLRALPNTPKMSRVLPRSKTLESQSVAVSEEDSPSPADALKARKRGFLRRRGTLRWIYSEDLRNCIFDDMLEEDVLNR